MSKTYTLTNSFHNTEATVRPQDITEGAWKGYFRVSHRTARRLHSDLCGVDGCICGDTFGARDSRVSFEIVAGFDPRETDYIVQIDN